MVSSIPNALDTLPAKLPDRRRESMRFRPPGADRDVDVLRRAQEAAEQCDLVVALGSTLSVQPACLIPLLAAQCGAPYVVVNRGLTDHDGLPEVALRLEGDVATIFPAAVQLALGPIHR